MKRTALWTFLLLCLAGPACRSPSADGGWQNLFDGTSLSGWRPWLRGIGSANPGEVFSVTNSQIRISGAGMGYLVTRVTFHDFHLVVEWRWGRTNTHPERIGKARDSGIFTHVTGPDGNSHDGAGAFRAGLEYNLMEGGTGDLLLIRGNAADGSLIAPGVVAETEPGTDADGWFTWRPGGMSRRIERWGRVNRMGKSADWTDTEGFVCSSGLERPAGAWNTSEIIAVGDRMEFRLNGRVVNRFAQVHPSAGAILLQCEGSEIFFRQVRLRPITSRP